MFGTMPLDRHANPFGLYPFGLYPFGFNPFGLNPFGIKKNVMGLTVLL